MCECERLVPLQIVAAVLNCGTRELQRDHESRIMRSVGGVPSLPTELARKLIDEHGVRLAARDRQLRASSQLRKAEAKRRREDAAARVAAKEATQRALIQKGDSALSVMHQTTNFVPEAEERINDYMEADRRIRKVRRK